MLEDILVRYGLVAVFVGAALEGDVTPLLAGVLAHLGILDLPFALAAVSTGGVAGDLAYYTIGHRGAPVLARVPGWRRVEPLVLRLSNRLGVWQIVFARFFYGTRIATMVFWGTRRLPLVRFLGPDALGASLWGCMLVMLGWFGSDRAEALVGDVKRVELWLGGALAAGLLAVLAFRALTRRGARGA
jgi:membrane protein DedA with SNARE-associated domain